MAKKTNVTIGGYKYARVTATVGFKDGERLRKVFYGVSKKDAENKRDKFLRGVNAGLSLDFDKVMFGQLFEQWFNNVKKISVSPNTFSRYDVDYRLRIKPSVIFNKLLVSVTPTDMQEYYNALADKYSYHTVKAVDKVLRMFFKYCVELDYITKSPLRAVKLPTEHVLEEGNINVFTIEDEAKIKAHAREKNFIYLFDLFTGLRIGELLALNHDDIDLDNNTVHVTKAVSKDGEKLVPLKTKASKRDVAISAAIMPLLKQHIKSEKEKHLRLGKEFTTQNPVFSSTACTHRIQRNVTKQWHRFLKKHEIERLPFKTLRATFCTMLAENGVPIKTASQIMGHSSIMTTEKHYLKIRVKRQHEAMKFMDDIKI